MTLTGQVWGRWEDEDRGSQGRGQPVSERFKQKVRKKGVEECKKAKETNITQVLKKKVRMLCKMLFKTQCGDLQIS